MGRQSTIIIIFALDTNNNGTMSYVIKYRDLININGRLYNPLVARMLSPDEERRLQTRYESSGCIIICNGFG